MKKIYIKDTDVKKLIKYLSKTEINKFLSLLGKFAKIYGMTNLAKDCGRNRESLYKVFSSNSKPKLHTIISILNCLGLNFTVIDLDNTNIIKQRVKK
jgi:probable addiction module antidote protein